jgi:hypothetical protein
LALAFRLASAHEGTIQDERLTDRGIYQNIQMIPINISTIFVKFMFIGDIPAKN